MPNIRQYSNPIEGLNVPQTGATAAAKAGETASSLAYYTGQALSSSINRFGGAAADVYEQHVVQPTIVKGAALLTGKMLDIGEKWRAMAQANPNDTTIGDKFREQVLGPEMETFLGGFNTSAGLKWAAQQTEAVTRHFNDRVTTDMMARASHALAGNVTTTANNAGAMVAAEPDPSTFTEAIRQVDASFDALIANTPNLAPGAGAAAGNEMRLKAKNGVVEAYITAVARRSPDEAVRILNSAVVGPHLTPTDRRQMEAAIRAQESITKRDQQAQRILDAQERKERIDKAMVDNWTKNITIFGDGSMSLAPGYNQSLLELAKNGANLHEIDFALQAGERLNARENAREELRIPDPALLSDFMRRASELPEDGGLTISEINKAFGVERRLNRKSFEFLMKWVTSEERNPTKAREYRNLTSKVNSLKSTITKSNFLSGIADGPGDVAFGRFEIEARDLFRQGRAAGRAEKDIFSDLERQAVDIVIEVAKLLPGAIANKAAGRPGLEAMIPERPLISLLPGNDPADVAPVPRPRPTTFNERSTVPVAPPAPAKPTPLDQRTQQPAGGGPRSEAAPTSGPSAREALARPLIASRGRGPETFEQRWHATIPEDRRYVPAVRGQDAAGAVADFARRLMELNQKQRQGQ